MADLSQEVKSAEAAVSTATAVTESKFSKAKTWVVGNAGKVVIGVLVLVAILVWKLL